MINHSFLHRCEISPDSKQENRPINVVVVDMANAYLKISPKQLAAAMGVSDGFASQIKTGRRKLPIKYLQVVSERFSIPKHQLRPDIFMLKVLCRFTLIL